MDVAIEIAQLTKRFPKVKSYRDILRRPFVREQTTALQSVSLNVRAGEIFSLLGPNGAGKTTLIKILSTIVLPTDGDAFVAGYDVKRHASQIKKKIGCVVTEERSFYWRLTGRQNLRFFAILNNLSKATAIKKTSEVIALVGLGKDADKTFKDYSTGMRHRLAIARALLTDAEILFFDEPTKSLDPPAAQVIRQLIASFTAREPKRTVLFATHDLMEAESLASRIAILDRGTMKACGTPSELRVTVSRKKRYIVKLRQPGTDVINLLHRIVSSCQSSGQPVGSQRSFLIEIDGSKDVSSVVRELVLAGGQVIECVAVQPSLAEVFESLTGKST